LIAHWAKHLGRDARSKALPSLLGDRNLDDFGLSLRCHCHVAMAFAQERPCEWGYVGKKPLFWIGLIFANDPICLTLSILTLDRHTPIEPKSISSAHPRRLSNSEDREMPSL